MSELRANRRTVVQGVGCAAAAAGLAACGGDNGTTGSRELRSGELLARAEDVPIDGGVVVSDARVVVTQPSAGDFRAFTAVCTHEGCLVSTPGNGIIPCQCHGSRFDVATGEVAGGPAESPLVAIPIVVEDGEIRRA